MAAITIKSSKKIIDQAKSASDTLKSMADKATEIGKGLKLEADIINYVGTVGKVASTAGGVLGVVSTGISFIMLIAGDSDLDPVSKGIAEIQQQISDLKSDVDAQFERLEKEIDISIARQTINMQCSIIDVVSENMKNYREAKQQNKSYDFYEEFLLKEDLGKLQTAVSDLEKYCSKDAEDSSVLTQIYAISYGDIAQVFQLGHYILSHALLAVTLTGMVWALQKAQTNPTDEEVAGWPSEINSDFESNVNSIRAEVCQWLEKCRKYVRSNLSSYFKKEVATKISVDPRNYDSHRGAGFVRASIEILLDLEKKYPWNHFAVITYTPVHGYDHHGSYCKDQAILYFSGRNQARMKDGDANIIIRWRPRKQGDREIALQTMVNAPKKPSSGPQKFISKLGYQLEGFPSSNRKDVLQQFAHANNTDAPSHSMFMYLYNRECPTENFDYSINFGFASRLPVFLFEQKIIKHIAHPISEYAEATYCNFAIGIFAF